MRHFLGLSARLVRASARLLVVALSVTTLGPVLHEVHDDELRPVVVAHDESAHHYQAAPDHGLGGSESEHCVACHFVRSSYGPASWEPSGPSQVASGKLLHTDGQSEAAPTATPRPARAPPLA